jgi:hypothetical protein
MWCLTLGHFCGQIDHPAIDEVVSLRASAIGQCWKMPIVRQVWW